MCREGDGLFPSPKEIELSCSCPDWADMCKHVAATLYGVGARLDQRPEHLFVLRGVDQGELIAGIGESFPLPAASASANVLADDDVAALFGIDMGETAVAVAAPVPEPARKPRRSAKAKKTAPRRVGKAKPAQA